MTTNNPIPPVIHDIDTRLHKLVSPIDILTAVSPLNYREQKQLFLQQQYSKEPEFVYRSHDIDSFTLKRNLFNLPLEKIVDDDLRQLYLDIVDSYIDKVDQYKSIGNDEFLYDSLRYYGEPSEKDIRNANFILHLPEQDDNDESLLNAEAIKSVLTEFADHEGYQYQLQIDDNMIAKALVSGTTVKINSTAEISKIETMALAHHELGVHLVTTLNARSQPLRILSLGSPVNTMTQEGLAILSEYLAGYMTVKRLKILALRVLAVESLIKDKSFRSTFMRLKEGYQLDDDTAFTITARVYRGGGLTKDYLYLQGFHQMLNAHETAADFTHLLTGKISLDHLPIITRLINKGILLAPERITPAFVRPVKSNDIDSFIVHAIK
ncbi:flavohemoglobin expression-modulating QEGLA motif protein [Teredinibacter purpureus]|uniref:flavohemoglobin expression-modulating QEGLA motif protein n=1 Tax=Teredinibacter purpureus TaxID=2731756 RepID=UPI0005F78D0E|nr:flavohemoglobin expression-modulating QEGLA motif protein [Teredinibacter purpureus]